jgi:hypothetical protein
MMAEWRQLGILTKIVCLGGLVSVTGLALMILTGMTRRRQFSLPMI